jgi:hypothetical protein
VRLALFAVLALGCGAALPLPTPGRAICYAVADQRAQERVDAECRAGELKVPFDECPAAQDIMAQLQREEEECK